MPKGYKGITYSKCHPEKRVASLVTMLCNNCHRGEGHWRDGDYRRAFGITLADYERMLLEQNGACQLCRWVPKPGNRRLAVDHDHKTGRIRGLLCGLCNKALGKVEQVVLQTVKDYLAY